MVERKSNLELFRIISMLLIVSHHYVVNSGILELIKYESSLNIYSIYLLLFGWGGKTGINCFVLITGYFMCKSNITLKKFIKLIFEIEFYKIAIYIIFVISGYTSFGLKDCIKSILPFYSLDKNFVGCYLILFMLIPFLNILVNNMNNKQHIRLLLICVVVMSLLPTLSINVNFNYISWFVVIYFIGSYIRLYPNMWIDSMGLCVVSTIILLVLSWGSVIICAITGNSIYHFVSDSNKLLALLLSVSAFCLFKNLRIPNSKIINIISKSTFGVLLIHASSDIMRNWLWKDLLKNTSYFGTRYIILHSILSVITIYIVCTIIDFLRIIIVEKPFMKLLDRAKSNTNNKVDN